MRFDVEKAKNVQTLLAPRIVERDMFVYPPRNVAGVDVAYLEDYAIGAAVLMDYEGLYVIETAVAAVKVDIPYVPTLLAFREIPAMAKAVKRLKSRPDVLLVDAHGKIHPRRLGAASHLGLILGIPTIGVAKKHLYGRDMGGNIVNGNEILGRKLDRGIYVSVGHMVSLDTAVKIVEKLRLYSLPEPVRRAHKLADKVKNMVKLGELDLDKIMNEGLNGVFS